MKPIIIGSRGSELALWQANHVKDRLEKLGQSVEIKVIKTQGDAIQHLSFDKLEGKGFFTKEIEDALLKKDVDLAVHSHKDLETTPPEGLVIAAVSERANPSDILLVRSDAADQTRPLSLPEGAVIGTSSARRKVQMRHHRPDVEINDLRGNVPTRIQKLRDGKYHAILLAKAGVDRLKLDLSEFLEIVLDPTEFVPAPAQGVLALQIREGDNELAEILRNLNDSRVQQRIALERGILNQLNGGCQLPLGAYCNENMELHVAHAPDSNSACNYLRYSVTDMDNMVSRVVEDIQSMV